MGLEEKLIEQIKRYRFIYDKNDDLYKQQKVKDKAWNKIAKKLNIKPEIAKKRWKTLRDRYRRKPETTPAPNSAIWKLREALQFLDDGNDNNKSDEDAIIELQMEDFLMFPLKEEPAQTPDPTPPVVPAPAAVTKKKETHIDMVKEPYKDIAELITTAKAAFSETTSVGTFLHALALQIEEANLSFKNTSTLQMELLIAVHNAIRRQNNMN